MAAFFFFVYNLLEQAVKKINSNDIYVHLRVRARVYVCVCVCRIVHLSKDFTLIHHLKNNLPHIHKNPHL